MLKIGEATISPHDKAPMASLAVTLKEEICRLARKEIKARTSATAQTVANHRRDIASLKRLVRDQAKRIAYLEAQE